MFALKTPMPKLLKQNQNLDWPLFAAIIHPSHSTQAELNLTLESLDALGYPLDELVIVASSSQSLEVDGPMLWSFSDQTEFAQVFQKLSRFSEEPALLILSSGVVLDTFSFQKNMDQGFSESGCLSVVQMPQAQYFDWSEFQNQKLSEQGLFSLKVWAFIVQKSEFAEFEFKTLDFDAESWDLVAQSEAENAAQKQSEATQNSSKKWGGIDSKLAQVLGDAHNPLIFSRNQCIDFYEKPADFSQGDVHVHRLEFGDSLNLVNKLRRIKHDDLQFSLFVFDNANVQESVGDNPLGRVGLYPADVRRLIEMAGYGVVETHNYVYEALEWKANWKNLQYDQEGALDLEKIHAISPRLLVKAVPLSQKYNLSLKVSVVLLALNKVDYTRQCIESLLKYSKQNIELILVDNGSTDSTESYFRSIPGAKVIRNEKNLGVSAGWNQGIRLAAGDYILILNNDTIFGPNTLENMVRCAQNHPEAACIAPRSNQIAGPQSEVRFNLSDIAQIPAHIDEIQKINDLSSWEFSRIKGFCMLMPTEIVRKTGFFDEKFGIGNFEDDDYSLRLYYQGYQMRVADDSFLFHYGSVSFNQAGIDWTEQMRKNMEIFDQKWQKKRFALDAHLQPHSALLAPISEQKAAHQQPKMSSAWEALKGQYYENARNLFIQELDGSEKDALTYRGLALALEGLSQVQDSFTCFCRSLELDANLETAELALEHLLAKHPQEQGREVLKIWAQKYPHLDLFDIKNGESSSTHSLSLPEWKKAVESYLAEQKVNDALDLLGRVSALDKKTFEYWNLTGIAHFYAGRVMDAFDAFGKALEINPIEPDTLMNYFDAGVKLNQIEKITHQFEYALSIAPFMDDVRRGLEEIKNLSSHKINADELIYKREKNIEIENAIREGLYERAGVLVSQLLREDQKNYRAWNNQGLIQWYHGDLDAACVSFKMACDINLWYTDALMNLYDTCILSQKLEFFKPVLDQAIRLAPTHRELLTIRSEIQNGKVPDRMQAYQSEAVQTHHLENWIKKGQDLLNEQKLPEAVIVFTDILKEHPDCDEAYNGVAISAFYNRHYRDAYFLFKKALEYKPFNQDVLLNLWDVAQHLGEAEQESAKEILRNAASVDHTLTEVQEIVEGWF